MDWISVENRMPRAGEEVMIWDGLYIRLGHRTLRDAQYEWMDDEFYPVKSVTHWMKIPDPPCIQEKCEKNTEEIVIKLKERLYAIKTEIDDIIYIINHI